MDAARLERIPLFADLEEHERADLASAMHDVDVEPGQTVVETGTHAYELFLIEEGAAEVVRDGEVVATLGEGDVFGEIGLLTTGTRTASVVATTPMRISALFIREFRQLERRTPSVIQGLRATMRERVLGAGS